MYLMFIVSHTVSLLAKYVANHATLLVLWFVVDSPFNLIRYHSAPQHYLFQCSPFDLLFQVLMCWLIGQRGSAVALWSVLSEGRPQDLVSLVSPILLFLCPLEYYYCLGWLVFVLAVGLFWKYYYTLRYLPLVLVYFGKGYHNLHFIMLNIFCDSHLGPLFGGCDRDCRWWDSWDWCNLHCSCVTLFRRVKDSAVQNCVDDIVFKNSRLPYYLDFPLQHIVCVCCWAPRKPVACWLLWISKLLANELFT